LLCVTNRERGTWCLPRHPRTFCRRPPRHRRRAGTLADERRLRHRTGTGRRDVPIVPARGPGQSAGTAGRDGRCGGSYLDDRMQRMATAYRRNTCGELVQVRQNDTGTGTVTLEPYRHPDGEYTITAELTAVRTDGPFGYKRHVCRGE